MSSIEAWHRTLFNNKSIDPFPLRQPQTDRCMVAGSEQIHREEGGEGVCGAHQNGMQVATQVPHQLFRRHQRLGPRLERIRGGVLLLYWGAMHSAVTKCATRVVGVGHWREMLHGECNIVCGRGVRLPERALFEIWEQTRRHKRAQSELSPRDVKRGTDRGWRRQCRCERCDYWDLRVQQALARFSVKLRDLWLLRRTTAVAIYLKMMISRLARAPANG